MSEEQRQDSLGRTSSPITIGVQVGGPKADEATNKHVLALRKVIREHLKGPYSPDVNEFALLLRVPGEIGRWDWFVEGCSRLRRNQKDRYISIDIGIPPDRWQNIPAQALREYIAHCIREAFSRFVARLRKDKSPIDDAALMRDLSEAMKNYLGTEDDL